jgi:uncharacterized protein
MSGEAIRVDFGAAIPLFPLRGVVLLPHATVPLHIFEPRYRALMRDALAGPQLIAMASFDGDAWQHDYHGNPPLRPVVCVGYILRHDRLPDGRFNLLLHGVARAAIVNELELHDDGYRHAKLRPITTQPPMEIDLADHRQRLSNLLHEEALDELAGVRAVHRWLTDEIPTDAVVDLVATSLISAEQERYAMLAEPDALRRADHLERFLRRTHKLVTTAKRYADARDPAGYPLN